MESHEQVNRILDELGSRLGVPLRLDDEGVCGLRYDGGLNCTLEVPPGQSVLRIYSKLVSAPTGCRESLLETALELNLYGLQTRGCALALDRAEQQILLCGSWPLQNLDVPGLENLLGSFLETAVELRTSLSQVTESDSPRDVDSATDGEVSDPMWRYMQVRG